jgi:flagellar biosynthesis protein FlhF
MELKRILARDIRAANEKAVAQYGPDVLVISSGQVNGLTELIVAVDLAPLPIT